MVYAVGRGKPIPSVMLVPQGTTDPVARLPAPAVLPENGQATQLRVAAAAQPESTQVPPNQDATIVPRVATAPVVPQTTALSAPMGTTPMAPAKLSVLHALLVSSAKPQ